jgi:hypothetical protein
LEAKLPTYPLIINENTRDCAETKKTARCERYFSTGKCIPQSQLVSLILSFQLPIMIGILLTALAINTGLSVLLGLWARSTPLGFRKVFVASAVAGALTGFVMVRNAKKQ